MKKLAKPYFSYHSLLSQIDSDDYYSMVLTQGKKKHPKSFSIIGAIEIGL